MFHRSAIMQRWIVAYDIPDQRRRMRLASLLEDFGDRTQQSVFELLLEGRDWEMMAQRIVQVIDPQQDKVRLYPVCQQCHGKIVDLGRVEKPPFDRPEVGIL